MLSAQEGITTMTRSEHLIHALHLFSPSLPIGAFAFSQGLEAAIESRHVRDAESLRCWCDGVMRFSVTTLDCHYAIAHTERILNCLPRGKCRITCIP